jgi:NAD(P)-dependent dehydrogenase (short-subunit alcohol dehydrogenase family)
MVEAAVERFGRLDIAVNAAYGVRPTPPEPLPPSGVFLVDQSTEYFAAVIDVGLVGPFRCVKHEARQMVTQADGGVIINLASINARQPAETMSAYCAAKAGVEMLTRCAALELGSRRVRVVAIAPGLVDTPMTSFLTANEKVLAQYLRAVPVGRAGTTSDVASAAAFLASDDASYISGETLVVDGGQLTKGFSL